MFNPSGLRDVIFLIFRDLKHKLQTSSLWHLCILVQLIGADYSSGGRSLSSALQDNTNKRWTTDRLSHELNGRLKVCITIKRSMYTTTGNMNFQGEVIIAQKISYLSPEDLLKAEDENGKPYIWYHFVIKGLCQTWYLTCIFGRSLFSWNHLWWNHGVIAESFLGTDINFN